MKQGFINIVVILLLCFGFTQCERRVQYHNKPTYDDPTISINRINNRGDIAVTIKDENRVVKSILPVAKNKLSPLGLLGISTKIGYSHELFHYDDFSLNVGVTTHSIYLGIGYALNPHTEVAIGIGNVPHVGFNLRIF